MGFGVDASQNYLTWGNVQPIQLTSQAKTGPTQFAIAIAKRRAPGFKELAPSGGVYTSQDLVWLLPAALVQAAGAIGNQAPKPGDLINAEGVAWTILECPLNTLRSTYRCMTRDLILAFDLRGTLSVKRPTATETDNAGSRVYAYTTVYSGIPCRFQEQTADGVDERGRRLTRRSFSVWVGQRLYLQKEDQIIDENGTVYEWMSSQDADRINQMQQLTCELR